MNTHNLFADSFNIKGIIFDLDGTLIDSRPTYIKAAHLAFKKLGLKPLTENMALEIPKKIEQHLPLDLENNTELELFLEIYLNFYYSISESVAKILPYTLSTLKFLSKRVKLSLVTMRSVSKNSLLNELKQFSLGKFFNPIVTAFDTKPKPAPDPLIKCIKKMNLHKEECLIVGDSVNDIRAGKAAGIKTIAVLSGIYSYDELSIEKPDIIIQNIVSLTDIIS